MGMNFHELMKSLGKKKKKLSIDLSWDILAAYLCDIEDRLNKIEKWIKKHELS